MNAGFADTDLKKASSTLSEGAVSIGDDGNAYILNDKEVVVVSPGGEITRRLIYTKPQNNQIATQVVVSGGLIAIVLSTIEGSDEPFISREILLIDSQSGEPFRFYKPSAELGNRMVCFSRNQGFTFLRKESGHLVRLTASIR